jgi:hypothetical protein
MKLGEGTVVGVAVWSGTAFRLSHFWTAARDGSGTPSRGGNMTSRCHFSAAGIKWINSGKVLGVRIAERLV